MPPRKKPLSPRPVILVLIVLAAFAFIPVLRSALRAGVGVAATAIYVLAYLFAVVMLPLMFYAFGMSVVAPILTLLVIDLFPHVRGLVASCQSFTQTMLRAVVAGVAAPLLSHDVRWLAAGELACAVLGVALDSPGRLGTHHRAFRRDCGAAGALGDARSVGRR